MTLNFQIFPDKVLYPQYASFSVTYPLTQGSQSIPRAVLPYAKSPFSSFKEWGNFAAKKCNIFYLLNKGISDLITQIPPISCVFRVLEKKSKFPVFSLTGILSPFFPGQRVLRYCSPKSNIHTDPNMESRATIVSVSNYVLFIQLTSEHIFVLALNHTDQMLSLCDDSKLSDFP